MPLLNKPLLNEIANLMASRLKRKAITKCSSWAKSYRRMGAPFPGPWSFKHHPWLKEMHDIPDADTVKIVGMKAAQMGFTEWAINRVLYNMDMFGRSALYMLPASKPDAADFSTGRFDPIIELSAHIAAMFSDTKNIGHKRAGHANLYIRGSRSRSQLKSIPVSVIVYDEQDEMVQENIALANERMSGQIYKEEIYISTPTVAGFGIDVEFENSTQNKFSFPCPCCSKWITLDKENLIITAENATDERINDTHIICGECHNKLEHELKTVFLKDGVWVPTYKDREIVGFNISQLYSTTMEPSRLAESFLKGQINPADEQEYYNSKLGKTHAPDGAKITDEDILGCIGGYLMKKNSQGLVTMGIDVGKFFHFEIDKWNLTPTGGSDINLFAEPTVVRIGKTETLEELYKLMQAYHIGVAVIDANPERRVALTFAKTFHGRVFLCQYGRGLSGRNLTIKKDTQDYMVIADRTSWMDTALPRFRQKRIQIPKNTPLEYKEQMKEPVRIFVKDSDGNPVSKYITASDQRPDHYAHARTYAEIALPLAVGRGVSHNFVEGA